MTKEEWVRKAEAKHGAGKYGYGKTNYVRAKDKIIIECYQHGDFSQTACSHTQGAGCPDCGREAISQSRTKGLATFLTEAQKVHGGDYDYRNVVWVNSGTSISVVCKAHGPFSITPKAHTGKTAQGCKTCTQEKWGRDRKGTTEGFIEKSKQKYGDQFSYEGLDYTNWSTPVRMTCQKHDKDFQVMPQYHLQSGGCPVCAKRRRALSTSTPFSDFLLRAREAHGEVYEYDELTYKGIAKPVKILCQIHGWFEQVGYVHTRSKVGCPSCTSRIPISQDEAIRRIYALHGEGLDYSLINFKGTHIPFKLRCIRHDHSFEALLHNVLNSRGNGCKVCSLESSSAVNSITFEEFLRRAKEVYPNLYSYKDYVNMTSPLTVTCPTHGEFTQVAYEHLRGYGCPQCNINKIEQEISNYLKSLGVEVEQSNRKILRSLKGNPMELDIFLPTLNIAVEVNGVLWHSERYGKDKHYHLHKTTECEKQGIQLIHIFDDEYNSNKSLIQNKLAHLCKKGEAIRVGARQCDVRQVPNQVYNDFMGNYHLQGHAPASVRIGLYTKSGELLAVAGFSKPRGIFKRTALPDGEWELIRYATHKDYHCLGGLGKLVAWFKKYVPFKTIITYADRRWSVGGCYDAVGFTKVGVTAPGYWYGDKKGKRHHRFTFAKHKLPGLFPAFDAELTEIENMANNGYFRVWDCGNLKYSLSSK